MTQASPEYVQTSLAAAMTLGLRPGLFFRNARLGCINLLLTYPNGCNANCAYCGLAKNRPGTSHKKSFIRVQWPNYPLNQIINKINERSGRLGRICLSMITHKNATKDTLTITQILNRETNLPISLLVSPTIIDYEDLKSFKKAGASHIGVAVDAATPELFHSLRGAPAGGPHKWDKYWECLQNSLDLFGPRHAGIHLVCGLGETERQAVNTMTKTAKMGGWTHLFSFYPEPDSAMAHVPQPPMSNYRRIQIARFLIDQGLSDSDNFEFNDQDQITGFGINKDSLQKIINSGEPFRTSGCPDKNGQVACNRPFANSLPGPNIRNYPFVPTANDIDRIKLQLNNSD